MGAQSFGKSIEASIDLRYTIKKEGDMMNAAVQLDEYTIEDIYNLPEGQRAELIDGEL